MRISDLIKEPVDLPGKMGQTVLETVRAMGERTWRRFPVCTRQTGGDFLRARFDSG